MKEKTKRNSSIELLRIISMIGVVILHYNNASMGGALGMVLDGSSNQYYLYLIESLFVCAVNVFVMISAYFLACNQNRKLIKILELFVQVIVFNLVFYVFGVLRGHKVFTVSSLISSLLPANYFLILYSVLYIISPYLNLIIKQLNKEQFKRLLIILMLIFSVWTIVIDIAENITGNTYLGLSTIGMYGSQYGYTIINFVLVYFVGAYLRVNKITLSKKKAGMWIIRCLAFLYAFSMMEHVLHLQYTATWYYNNPIIILMSAYILLFFMDIHFESKIINELLKGLQEIDGNTYYFYSYDGHMAYSSWYDEDTITDNGLIVTVNKSGIVTNYANIVVGDWTHYRDKWYYYDADMNPYIGVKTINGVEYYFNYGQLAEYLDKVVTSGDTLAYVRDGKVIEKAKFKDNELIYLNGNCYYYYLNDAGYYYPYDGEYTVDGKSLYFIYGMLQTSDSDEILTDYRNDYLYAYNNKGEIVDKVKRVAGWNEIGNDWYYVSSEMNFVDGIYTVNGKEYYFENGRLIKSSNGISVVSSYRDENDKIVTYVIAYNSEGVVVEKKKAVANTWIQLRGKWYYYDKNLNEADGKMTTGWLEENDSWYYLDKDGQKNNWLVNIKW